MKKRHLLFFAAVVLILATLLVGCSDDSNEFDGKNIVKFVLNDGTLDYKTASTNTEINFVYHPGSYILDPAEIPGYKLYRTGYNFTGWYTDKDCSPANAWNFKTPFELPELTLYAGWEKAVTYSYTVCYVDGDKEVSLGVYDKVSEGDRLVLSGVFEGMDSGEITLTNKATGEDMVLECSFTERQKKILKAGSLLSFAKENK